MNSHNHFFLTLFDDKTFDPPLNYFDDYETALKYYTEAFSIKQDELYAENIGSIYYKYFEILIVPSIILKSL